MISLNEFYKETRYIDEIRPIIEQKSTVSLRILDWFITNYSKKYRVILNKSFDVYQNYKLMLRSFSKKAFDPFCRKNKILFYYADNEFIETSCGQLCFFRWCFQNDILKFVETHLEEIENDMKDSLKQTTDNTVHHHSPKPTDAKSSNRTAKKTYLDKKRQPLSISASRSITKRHVSYTISFD